MNEAIGMKVDQGSIATTSSPYLATPADWCLYCEERSKEDVSSNLAVVVIEQFETPTTTNCLVYFREIDS